MKPNHQRMMSVILSSVLFTLSGFCYALPFNIFPKVPLPTEVPAGGSVTALYTVQNNTISARVGNFVKYLPPNVTQVLADPTYPDLCSATFNLSNKGVAGDSCTLELRITGAVKSNDPDPHHHLFVCFPGGTTCAGTLFPLNISVKTPTPPPPTPTAVRVAYIANNTIGNNTISICPVLETGNLGPCVPHPDPTFNRPVDIILNNTNTYAYVLNRLDAGVSTISICPVNPDGSLSTCTNPATTVPTDTTFGGLTFNPEGTRLYYTSYFPEIVYICPVNPDGSLDPCVANPDAFDGPNGRMAFNSAGTIAYVPQFNSASVSICTTVDSGTGFLSDCTSTTPTPDFPFQQPFGLAINPSNSHLYVANLTTPSELSICPIPLTPGTCIVPESTGNGTFDFGDIAENFLIYDLNGVSYAYLPNGDLNTVSICPVQADGSLGLCVAQPDATFSEPSSIWIATFS